MVPHGGGGPDFRFLFSPPRSQKDTRAIVKRPLYAHETHTKVSLRNQLWL
jgi:hypothetical protein